jgi:hypothetical protein
VWFYARLTAGQRCTTWHSAKWMVVEREGAERPDAAGGTPLSI